ncbi:MAG: methyltransferase domain-containing protein [Beijerinckiaceae bacterium]
MTDRRQVPQIFDRMALRQRLARAQDGATATFLLDRVIEDLCDRLAVTLRPFPRVLDIETPLPALANALAALPGARRIVRLAPVPEPEAHGFETVAGDAEALPFAVSSFDLVVSALALQWVNDLPGTLVQIRRALAPDGLFLGCLAGGQTLHELRQALTQAEAEISGGASPRVSPFADLRDLGALLQRAGFALPVADADTITVRYDNVFALMADLRAMGATNILTQRSRKFLRRSVLLRAAEIYAERFADADGRIRATFEIVWLSGWAPHESQQKPLQPGSARMRLADALKTKDYGEER